LLIVWLWIIVCLSVVAGNAYLAVRSEMASYDPSVGFSGGSALLLVTVWIGFQLCAVIWGVWELVLAIKRGVQRWPRSTSARWSVVWGVVVVLVVAWGFPLGVVDALVSGTWLAPIGLALGIRAWRVGESSRLALAGMILNGVVLVAAMPTAMLFAYAWAHPR
jgi:hypothetical protein